MKKRIFAILLAAALVFSLAACGSSSSSSSSSSAPAQTAAPAAAAATEAPAASGVDFPKEPIRFIVQYGAGGGVDVTARLVAKYAEKYLGQSIVVENVTGGSGIVGQTELANAAPDGYTIGMIFANTAVDILLTEGVTYTLDSFAPVCQVNFDPAFMITRAGGDFDIGLENVIAETQKEELTMGIGALWQAFDFVKMSLQSNYDAPFTRIAYDGGAAAVTSCVAGDTDVAMCFPNEWMSYYKSGDLSGLAVAAPERLESFPDVPTFAELGYTDITSFGVRRVIVAPAGTDPEILKILENAFLQALADPALVAEYAELGMSCVPAGADEAYASLKAEGEILTGLLEGFDVKPGDAPK